jgi:hypothetical protein
MAFAISNIRCWDKGIATQANSHFVLVFPNNSGFSTNGEDSDEGQFEYEPESIREDGVDVVCEYGTQIQYEQCPDVVRVTAQKFLLAVNEAEWIATHSPSGISR